MAYELDAIAMVVIGGTSLAGGKGGIITTLIGVLTIGYLQKILSLNAAPGGHSPHAHRRHHRHGGTLPAAARRMRPSRLGPRP